MVLKGFKFKEHFSGRDAHSVEVLLYHVSVYRSSQITFDLKEQLDDHDPLVVAVLFCYVTVYWLQPFNLGAQRRGS